MCVCLFVLLKTEITNEKSTALKMGSTTPNLPQEVQRDGHCEAFSHTAVPLGKGFSLYLSRVLYFLCWGRGRWNSSSTSPCLNDWVACVSFLKGNSNNPGKQQLGSMGCLVLSWLRRFGSSRYSNPKNSDLAKVPGLEKCELSETPRNQIEAPKMAKRTRTLKPPKGTCDTPRIWLQADPIQGLGHVGVSHVKARGNHNRVLQHVIQRTLK